jgi:AcrR family transcriptional regulator
MKTEAAPKDKLFQTAASLFYQHGYRATGVDTIAAESGIGKMTLYRHYPSKDDLIVAYLRDSNELFWNGFEQITRDVPTPREKLLAFFQALQDYVKDPACYGCPFLNAAAEYPETGHPGHQVALEHKQSVRDRGAGRSALSLNGRRLHGLTHLRHAESRCARCRRRACFDRCGNGLICPSLPPPGAFERIESISVLERDIPLFYKTKTGGPFGPPVLSKLCGGHK